MSALVVVAGLLSLAATAQTAPAQTLGEPALETAVLDPEKAVEEQALVVAMVMMTTAAMIEQVAEMNRR